MYPISNQVSPVESQAVFADSEARPEKPEAEGMWGDRCVQPVTSSASTSSLSTVEGLSCLPLFEDEESEAPVTHRVTQLRKPEFRKSQWIEGGKRIASEATEKQLLSCGSGFELPDISAHKEIVATLSELQLPGVIIDEFSLNNMAAALLYADINSVEKAQQLNLKIVPPGPVFHTWYAFYGTTLFDGKNNPKGLDYVSLIAEKASKLSEKNIPVIFIYTNNSMSKSQIEEMNQLFEEHDNILVLSIEEDLSESPMVDKFKKPTAKSVELMDDIRICVILDADYVLSVAGEKSKRLGKKELCERLTLWQNKSLTYADIDVDLIRPDVFQIHSNGMCETSGLNLRRVVITQRKSRHYSKSELERIRDNNSYFKYLYGEKINKENLEAKSDKAFRYIISDEFKDVYKKLTGKELKHPWRPNVYYYNSVTGLLPKNDIASIIFKKNTHDAFCKQFKIAGATHSDQIRLARIDGIQQLRILRNNFDRSWTGNSPEKDQAASQADEQK